MQWVFLSTSIVLEMVGTLSLRMASRGHRAWFALVALGYAGAFIMLTFTLSAGMSLGVAYGIWAASGVALTAVASRILFQEPLTSTMLAGIALIAAGVLLVELGAAH